MTSSPEKNSAERPPLGLPAGSIRALLTLLIVSVVIVEVMRGHTVGLLWTETLMIVLAHYFTSRRFVRLPSDVVRQLEAEGHLEAEQNPLYLPRHSIRAVVIASFAGLAVYLYQQGRLMHSESLAILVTVFAYLVGVVGRGVLDWWTARHGGGSFRWWADFKAAVVLLVLTATAATYLFDSAQLFPEKMQLLALGLVLFYFGSR